MHSGKVTKDSAAKPDQRGARVFPHDFIRLVSSTHQEQRLSEPLKISSRARREIINVLLLKRAHECDFFSLLNVQILRSKQSNHGREQQPGY